MRAHRSETWRKQFENSEIDKLWIDTLNRPDKIEIQFSDYIVKMNMEKEQIIPPMLCLIQSEFDPIEDLERASFMILGTGYIRKIFRGTAEIKGNKLYRCTLIPISEKKIQDVKNTCVVLKRAGILNFIITNLNQD